MFVPQQDVGVSGLSIDVEWKFDGLDPPVDSAVTSQVEQLVYDGKLKTVPMV